MKIIEANIKFKLSSDFFFQLFLGLLWASTILVNYFKAILIRLPYIKYISGELITAVFVFALLLALPYMLKKISPFAVLFYLAVCFVYLSNYIVYPENMEFLQENLVPFLVKSLPMIFVGMSINLKKHYRLLYYISIASVVLKFIQLLFDPVNFVYGDMHSSYVLLPHVCMVLATAFSKATVFNSIVSAIGVVTIIAFGTRGPVLCLVVLVITCIIMFKSLKEHKWFYSGVIAFSSGFAIYYNDILQWLLALIERMDMSTRVLDMLLYGDVMFSSGRNTIQTVLFGAIKSNWFGYGIASDRTIVGMYSHNLFIEFWVSYGIVFGTILFVVPIIYTLKLLFMKWKNKSIEDGFILVLISSSFVKLLLSGSYLTESLLFLLAGVVISEYKKEKLQNR